MPHSRTGARIPAVESHPGASTMHPKPFEHSIARHLDRLPYGAYKAFADGLDRSDTWVTRMRDPSDGMHIHASDAARACQLVGTVEPLNATLAGVRIAGRNWHVVPCPEHAAPEDLRLDAAQASASLARTVADLFAALADGRLDASERAEIERDLVSLHEEIGGLLAGVRGAK